MLRYLVVSGGLLLMLLSATPGLAVEAVDAVITTAIVDREPVDSVEAFPIQNGKLYCFTRIIGAEDSTVVYHACYRDEQLMSRVELPVNSPDWRTWSAKRFLEDWPGKWHVEIQDANGNRLQKVDFSRVNG